MPGTSSGQRPVGVVVGSAIAIAFGTVFVLVNSGDVATPWSLVIRTLGLLVAAALVVGLVVVIRAEPSIEASAEAPVGVDGETMPLDRRYWLVVALEAAALFGGLAVINDVLHRTAVSVAWVALVVGAHFFGLGRIWRMHLFHRLGAAMTALGLAGFLIYTLGGSVEAVALVAGVGSGAALYAAVGIALRDALRGELAVSTSRGTA